MRTATAINACLAITGVLAMLFFILRWVTAATNAFDYLLVNTIVIGLSTAALLFAWLPEDGSLRVHSIHRHTLVSEEAVRKNG